ncbi:MAG: glycosyltransferase, partial [Thermodesulfovibrionales bacterium]|nr:glycosyltransferase [Thermodesulfovibrionales bacterium]
EILGEYKHIIKKIYNRPAKGVPDAMNFGITEASGEIIGMIHADDYYADRTVVSRVAEAFNSSKDILMVYGTQDYVHPETKEVLLRWGRDTDPTEIKKRMYIPHPTVFAKKELYDNAGLFSENYRCACDYEWALRVVKHTRPYFIDHTLAVMRDMGGSGVMIDITLKETARALREQGHYWAYVMMIFRNMAKSILIKLGLKSVIFKVWERSVRPKG